MPYKRLFGRVDMTFKVHYTKDNNFRKLRIDLINRVAFLYISLVCEALCTLPKFKGNMNIIILVFKVNKCINLTIFGIEDVCLYIRTNKSINQSMK